MSEPGTQSPPAPAITRIWLRDFVEAFGDMSRPFGLYMVGGGTFWAIISKDVDATKLGAAGLILGALFGTKGFERIAQTRADADVKKSGGTV